MGSPAPGELASGIPARSAARLTFCCWHGCTPCVGIDGWTERYDPGRVVGTVMARGTYSPLDCCETWRATAPLMCIFACHSFEAARITAAALGLNGWTLPPRAEVEFLRIG